MGIDKGFLYPDLVDGGRGCVVDKCCGCRLIVEGLTLKRLELKKKMVE